MINTFAISLNYAEKFFHLGMCLVYVKYEWTGGRDEGFFFEYCVLKCAFSGFLYGYKLNVE